MNEPFLEGIELYVYLAAIVLACFAVLDLLKVTNICDFFRWPPVSTLVMTTGILFTPVLIELSMPVHPNIETSLAFIPILFIIAGAILKKRAEQHEPKKPD